MTTEFGLVLGGGGGVGVAWEIGVIHSLIEAGAPILDAAAVVGTSAGSIVGAQVFGGRSFADMLAEQATTDEPPQMAASEGANAARPEMADLFVRLAQAGSREERARLLGQLALDTPSPMSEDVFLGMMQDMIQVSEWPESTRFLPTVVDCETGALRVLSVADGVPLIRAVAGSCSVPMVVPPVTIEGRKYIDGGVASPSNLDVLLDYGLDRIVFIGPFGGPHSPPLGDAGEALNQETARARAAGAAVLALLPGPDLVPRVGTDFLRTTNRPIALECGIADGKSAAEALTRFLA